MNLKYSKSSGNLQVCIVLHRDSHMATEVPTAPAQGCSAAGRNNLTFGPLN